MKAKSFVVAGAAVFGLWTAAAPAPVVFDTPAKDEKGMMVLGNGEVGATAWLDAAGTLHTVLQNSDSWNEGGRHVKTGAIDYETKSPVDAGTYRQELSMERGEFEATWKSGGRAVSLRYRIQQGTDSIAVCDVKGASDVEAKVVNWRLYPGGSKEFGVGEYELGNRFCEGGPHGKVLKNKKFTISADRLVPGGWCHVNRNETVAELMKVYDYYQATGDLGKPDLLSDRAFGGVTRKLTGTTGVSPVVSVNGQDARSPSVLFLTAITCYHPCRDADEWLRRTNEMLDRDGWTLDGEEAKRAAHIAWWRAFWNRSHIAVTPAAAAKDVPPKLYDFPTNSKLPLSFGIDSKGGNKFLGTFARAEVTFGGKVVYSGVPKAGQVIATGKMPVVPGFHFTCKFTTDHLEKPQRLLDNMTPGGRDGFIVDVYQGRVRAIFGAVQMHHHANVVPGRETTLEVSVSRYGTAEIIVNGKSEKKELGRPVISLADECEAITTAYAAQRYLTACAARGRLPIRFNGSLFTISHRGDPDYRRWGNGYWWQNTRLPYYPMFAAGDIDGTDALFNMYLSKLEFFKKRTKKYFGHDGAFFSECMQPWGDHFIGSYGPECEWKFRKDKHQYHPCHKYAWVGQLELSLMAIMRWQHTRDDEWFKKNALPSIREYVRYFDGHFKLDAKGRYHMYPAQAIETWQDCTNPMTEVAGLTRVTDLLLAMPDGVVSADDRAFFAKIRARLPELPTRTLENRGVVFAPAEIFKRHGNVETPELYCVFPFRLSSFEKPNAEIGRRTYTEGRFHKLYFGWAQDELNAAYLGMAEEAREHIVDRVFKNTPTLGRTIACNEENIAERAYRPSEYRWPAYWGPNYNWRPDQDEGGVFQNTIQSMLLQYEGDKIFLLPAWPKEWNCDFKLNAPKNTTVEGRVENGELKDLVVTPAARRKDVVVCGAGALAKGGGGSPCRSMVWVEAETFADKGGWALDQQFIDQMGSSFLLAHGMGEPVADAVTTVDVPKGGRYRVLARTRNWCAEWSAADAPGKFQVLVNGVALPNVMGAKGGEWAWHEAGEIDLAPGRATLALHDLTGFDGRCDALVLTADAGFAPPQSVKDLDAMRRKLGIVSRAPAEEKADFVVVGGGVAGICAAISAARLGVKVALINDRPVLGGCNSSEVRVHLGGWANIGPYPRLGDVVAEIGPAHGGNAQTADRYEDGRKLAAVAAEKNIRLVLSTRVTAVETSNGNIASVTGRNVETGVETVFRAPLFADCTGDGALAALAGAECRYGREARGETGEAGAVEKADSKTMGASVQWYSRAVEKDSPFPDVKWALPFSAESCQKVKMGEWTWETGMSMDMIGEFERIRDYGMLVVYSNWAFLKNHSKWKAEYARLKLAWVAHVAGKRESRRVVGDHVLNENDLLNNVEYPDGTACTTWTIDLHYPDPKNTAHFPGREFKSIAKHKRLKAPYPVPYRCLYAKDVGNLLLAGRHISVTHVALGTVRVMRTLGMLGEVVGMAAKVCTEHGCSPRDVYRSHLEELKSMMRRGVGTGRRQPPQNYNCGGFSPAAMKKFKW